MLYTAATTVPFSLGLEQESIYLCVLPTFWMAGEVLGVLFLISAGVTVVLSRSPMRAFSLTVPWRVWTTTRAVNTT